MKKIRVPSLRLHKSTGQAVVTLSGKDFYLGSFDSREASHRYAKLLAQWEATHLHPPLLTRPWADDGSALNMMSI